MLPLVTSLSRVLGKGKRLGERPLLNMPPWKRARKVGSHDTKHVLYNGLVSWLYIIADKYFVPFYFCIQAKLLQDLYCRKN